MQREEERRHRNPGPTGRTLSHFFQGAVIRMGGGSSFRFNAGEPASSAPTDPTLGKPALVAKSVTIYNADGSEETIPVGHGVTATTEAEAG